MLHSRYPRFSGLQFERTCEEAFLTAFEQVKAFARISADKNAID